jgi:hypothetical protein
MNNEPVAWTDGKGNYFDKNSFFPVDDLIPLYTHPAKTQLSNGHLSDCGIHNEPAIKNKDCDCGFEPKFDLADLKHEDNCRYFDDELYCSCGADSYALVEWYRHKEVTHPAKTLTDEEIDMLAHEYNCIDDYPHEFVRACIRKAQEK